MPEYHSITTALAALEAAPLSRRRAMLLALLIDAEIERRFAAGGEDDVLAFREQFAGESPALGLAMALAAMQSGGPSLVTEPVEVPIANYPALREADYMVSLYNSNTVPRLRIALPDGERRDALEVLRQAVEELARQRHPPTMSSRA